VPAATLLTLEGADKFQRKILVHQGHILAESTRGFSGGSKSSVVVLKNIPIKQVSTVNTSVKVQRSSNDGGQRIFPIPIGSGIHLTE
jgi:hypothetical protein